MESWVCSAQKHETCKVWETNKKNWPQEEELEENSRHELLYKYTNITKTNRKLGQQRMWNIIE